MALLAVEALELESSELLGSQGQGRMPPPPPPAALSSQQV